MRFFKNMLMEEATGGESTIMGGGGGGQQSTVTNPSVNGEEGGSSWRDSLPEELKNDPGLSTVSDVNALAKMYVNSQKLIGKDKVVIPDQHATEDDWRAFYTKVGLPETIDKYEIKGPKDAKFIDKETLSELKPLAHKLGVLPKQLEGILDWYEGRIGGQTQAHADQMKQESIKNVESLKKDFGQAFEQKLSYATRLIEENQVDGIGELMKDPQFGNNPVLIKVLSQIGEKLYKEADMRDGGTGKFALSPAEAQEKINTIQGNFDHPYHKPEHPSHQNAVDEVKKLFEAAFSE